MNEGTTKRLEAIFPDLVAKLQRAGTTKQRAECVAASEFAITRARVEHPLVMRALEKVRASGMLNQKEMSELDELVGQLDEKYFALQEAAEEGRASAAQYVGVFGQARAVAALCFARGNDAFHAATEAIYEAAAAVDDKAEFVAIIDDALR